MLFSCSVSGGDGTKSPADLSSHFANFAVHMSTTPGFAHPDPPSCREASGPRKRPLLAGAAIRPRSFARLATRLHTPGI